ncbi:MAG: dihydrolipoyl dehydrogenase [Caulobacteraceae bacterium]|nr:dihydrolipoyl dehydrogenase [Caulobacteraceae bacterium]
MTEHLSAKVLVVGAGPGGYVAAIRCGQIGLDTVIIEADRLGGTCLIRGCIPSKALIHAAGEYATVARARDSGRLGIRLSGEVSLDLAETVLWKDGIVDKLSAGVGSLLRRAKVRVEAGWGVFQDAKTCLVTRADGTTVTISAENVILATGSEAVEAPDLPWSDDVLSSTEALSMRALPERLAIVGAGYIGLELGMALRRMGCEVSVVEAQDRILPQYDPSLTAPVVKALSRQGIRVELSTLAKGYKDGVLSGAGRDGRSVEIRADKVLVTIGRRPRTRGWGLEAMGVDMAGPFVKIDDQCRTSMTGVWAIGDLVGEPMLAHKASAQGEMVAENIAGASRVFDPVAIPAVCFTEPEIVVVGSLETGADTLSAVFPLSANGRALSMDSAEEGGFIKVSARASDHRLLGLAAVGSHVSELSGEMTVLLEMGAVLEDVAAVIHAHPTQSEGVHEAAHRALGHPIHI